MIFVSLALQHMSSNVTASRGSSSELLALLLDIAVTREDQLNSASMEAVVKLARDAIGHTLRIMSAKDFIFGVLKVLESDKTTVSCFVLNALAKI